MINSAIRKRQVWAYGHAACARVANIKGKAFHLRRWAECAVCRAPINWYTVDVVRWRGPDRS